MITTEESTYYAIQVNKGDGWYWSLFYDKPFASEEGARTALRKRKEPEKSTWKWRIVQITPLAD
jgi:hypothetical protein